MKTKIFAVFDQQAQAYMSPFFTPTEGLAHRMFREATLDEKTTLAKHPNDFSLFYLGEWDDNSAIFEPAMPPRRMATSTEVISNQ